MAKKPSIMFWLDNALRERFAKACQQNYQTMSEVLRQLVLSYVKKNEEK